MKYHFLIYIAALSMFTSCATKDDFEFDREKYVAVLADLTVQGQLTKKSSGTTKDSLDSLYRAQIEEIHDISLIKYESDIKKIQLDPERYKALVEDAFDLLKSREKELVKQKK